MAIRVKETDREETEERGRARKHKKYANISLGGNQICDVFAASSSSSGRAT